MPEQSENTDEVPSFRIVTIERIADWFADQGLKYFFYEEEVNDLGVIIDSIVNYVTLRGSDPETMQVRAHWNRTASVERTGELLSLCNEWNRDRTWPKAYVRISDRGQVMIFAESSFDVVDGCPDAQLHEWLNAGLRLSAGFFAHLDEHFPDPLLGAS